MRPKSPTTQRNRFGVCFQRTLFTDTAQRSRNQRRLEPTASALRVQLPLSSAVYGVEEVENAGCF